MKCDDSAFIVKKYLFMTLDPVHIGTGGYGLGMVNNPIMRDAGTELPKIPGTSLCGVARAYTAMYFPEKYQRQKKDESGNVLTDEKGNPIFVSCAGKGGKEGEGHCGERNCPVCIPYGFTKKNKSFQGLAQFSDARILFFPVYSIMGPVWISSPDVLRELYPEINLSVSKDRIKMIKPSGRKHLNLGWVMFEVENNEDISFNISLPNDMQEVIKNRLILVSDENFSQLVNDNLEIRTSVSIDPQTGAAEPRALFTYEAIPRATVLWSTITYLNPKNYLVPQDNSASAPVDPPCDWETRNSGKKAFDWVIDSVEKGLKHFEHLGVGGMGTRGMGRMRWLNKTSGEKDDEKTT